MEPFELKVDTDTIYIKIIRFLGILMLGFAIGVLTMKYKYSSDIDWLNAVTLVGLSFVFALFPGRGNRQSIIINEDGITLHHYPLYWGGEKQYQWNSIEKVEVEKNYIVLRKTVGSTSKIKLPIHTQQQVEDLKTYLQQLVKEKEINFKV